MYVLCDLKYLLLVYNLLLFSLKKQFYVYEYFDCVYTTCVPGAQEGQKTVSVPQELELTDGHELPSEFWKPN